MSVLLTLLEQPKMFIFMIISTILTLMTCCFDPVPLVAYKWVFTSINNFKLVKNSTVIFLSQAIKLFDQF